MSDERQAGTDPLLRGDDGERLYVVTSTQFGKSYSWVVAAESLAEAKRAHGWTRELYATRRVRAARQSDAGLRRDG